ncbi:A24 family peptidase [Deefgea tanakiae]|uniref:Prepilin leader peptidase/N-methyltransferase n=1 Tax=Deefgea tanakiae TaxID=2865840 RepID=A0ABX8Z7L9_9NEIS|nr:A24 family peptidase [Deefgea tanakiae]QZA77063.1 A24 family peptidase [Deefgea tanakiae]
MDNFVTLLYDPIWLCYFIGLIGLTVGSFLNVVIHRLPIMLENDFKSECAAYFETRTSIQVTKTKYNLCTPRSACPKCGHTISALENIPVISWIALRGKCRKCKAKISIRYPIIELITAFLSAGLALHFGYSYALAGGLILVWFLIALIMIDADTYLLPDSMTLPLIWVGLIFNSFNTFTTLDNAVYGAIAGYISLWSVYWVFKLATSKEGMGYGDFKLLAALGAWFGWSMIPMIILLSSFAGAVIGIVMVLGKKRGWNKPMPFGPYLGVAGLLALIWGKDLSLALYGIS